MARYDWLFFRLHQESIFKLRLDLDLSIRLWALGFKTVGALDQCILDYREEELYGLIGRKEGREAIAALMEFCRKRLRGLGENDG